MTDVKALPAYGEHIEYVGVCSGASITMMNKVFNHSSVVFMRLLENLGKD